MHFCSQNEDRHSLGERNGGNEKGKGTGDVVIRNLECRGSGVQRGAPMNSSFARAVRELGPMHRQTHSTSMQNKKNRN